jgi:hypothetical protein
MTQAVSYLPVPRKAGRTSFCLSRRESYVGRAQGKKFSRFDAGRPDNPMNRNNLKMHRVERLSKRTAPLYSAAAVRFLDGTRCRAGFSVSRTIHSKPVHRQMMGIEPVMNGLQRREGGRR